MAQQVRIFAGDHWGEVAREVNAFLGTLLPHGAPPQVQYQAASSSFNGDYPQTLVVTHCVLVSYMAGEDQPQSARERFIPDPEVDEVTRG